MNAATTGAVATAPAGLIDPAERPGLGRLSRVEFRKMVDTRAGLWLLIVTALAAVGGVVGEILAAETGTELIAVFDTSMLSASVLLPVVAILLVTGEWSQRSALWTFAMTPRRSRILLAKLIAIAAITAIATVVCLAVAAIGVAIDGGSMSLPIDEALRTLLYQALSVLMGFAFGAALMISPLAIVAIFVAPMLIGALTAISAIEEVVAWIDISALQTLTDPTISGGDWAKILSATAFWIAVPLVVGFWRHSRRDVS